MDLFLNQDIYSIAWLIYMILNFINVMIDWLSEKDKILYSLSILGISILLMLLVVSPAFGKKYLNNTPALDLQYFGYSINKAQDLLDRYKDTGRKKYIIFALTQDIVFPVLYSLFLSIVLTLELASSKGQIHDLLNIRLLPFVVTLLDISENIGIVILLRQFPELKPSSVKAASILTVTKWIALLVTLLLVVVLAVFRLVTR